MMGSATCVYISALHTSSVKPKQENIFKVVCCTAQNVATAMSRNCYPKFATLAKIVLALRKNSFANEGFCLFSKTKYPIDGFSHFFIIFYYSLLRHLIAFLGVPSTLDCHILLRDNFCGKLQFN